MQSFSSLACHGAENELSQGSRVSYENFEVQDFEGFLLSRALSGSYAGFLKSSVRINLLFSLNLFLLNLKI